MIFHADLFETLQRITSQLTELIFWIANLPFLHVIKEKDAKPNYHKNYEIQYGTLNDTYKFT